ncbi:23145_t:CDS:2, partial [Racocetra persica]
SQRKTLVYLWNKGVHSAKELYARTGIPRSTIYNNIKRLKKQIKKDSSISTRTLAAYLSSIGNDISYRTIERHLAIMGYVKNIPQKTSILTNDQKRKRHWHKKGQQPIRPIPKDRTKIKKFYVEIVRKHLPEVKKM